MEKQLILTLEFSSVECNGYPTAKIKIDDLLVSDITVSEPTFVDVPIDETIESHILTIERYGKTYQHSTDDKDQILELKSIKLDGIDIPEHILFDFSKFEFNDQVHVGSRYFGPNGVWSFNFKSPFISWILDQKIVHEAKYSQDYLHEWAWMLGPDSVTTLSKELSDALERINNL